MLAIDQNEKLKTRRTAWRRLPRSLMITGALTWLAGCLSLPPQAPVDLTGPDWTVRNGQAVWKQSRDGTEIAGELLVASHPDGSAIVQFTKPPLPFASARQTPGHWQVQFFAQNQTYAGRGRPPARVIWLQLPLALAGRGAASGWLLTRGSDDGWRFENTRSGESLAGFLLTTKSPPPPLQHE
jgi:hypothetical protein